MNPNITSTPTHLIHPGLATAHSHAFQRALRGRTQRPATQADSFWSWRGLMYHLAERLDPDTIYDLSRLAFVELAMSGVTAVGEFHYVHFDQDGRPYAQPQAMAEAVIRAARDVGLRITLIVTAYLRGGYKQPLTGAQSRFAHADVDAVISDVDALRSRWDGNERVRIGMAAHSVRAVEIGDALALWRYAKAQALPFHMHVSEQERELTESVTEYGRTPVDLLAAADMLDSNFVAVHATHLSEQEILHLGAAGATVCLCRTTERDLGDGLPKVADLRQAGVKLCVGVDSHCAADAYEEIRAVELDDRSRTERRIVAATAPELLEIGTKNGYEAIGWGTAWHDDRVLLRRDDPSLLGAADDLLADMVIFGATPRAVDEVWVGERQIVADGVHVSYEEAHRRYEQAIANLFNS